MPEDRRLAAIMFTDIVGYTALMGSDEDKAFKVLRKNREIQRPIIKKYRGEWLKEMGDGILASFHTASDAVRCADEIQKEAKEEGIGLRIGIHEGEVVFEGGDVLGDGVNVASRLEEIADDGCINISGAVFKDIKNKAGISTEFIEEKTLKNIDEPVKVYRVSCEESNNETNQTHTKRKFSIKYIYYLFAGFVIIIVSVLAIQYLKNQSPPSTITKEKSIAVRPFWNESIDPENEPFVNGITEDIRNNLAKISDLRVISRGSMEKYRDTNLPTSDIAEEVNVSFLLEGTVQRYGTQVKIHAQLIDAELDDHIWEETFERDISDIKEIFKLQGEIAQIIAEELYSTITPQEKEIIDIIPTTNLNAYDFFMRARDTHTKCWAGYWEGINDREALEEAIKLYRRALELDSTYAQAYTGLALAYWNRYGEETFFEEDYLDSIMVLADKALSFDDQLEEAYYVKYVYDRHAKGNFQAAINNLEIALQINPNFTWAFEFGAYTYIDDLDNYLQGIKNLHKAASLDHSFRLPRILYNLSSAYGNTGFFNEQAYYFQEAFKLSADSIRKYRYLANRAMISNNYETDTEMLLRIYDLDSTDHDIIGSIIHAYNILGNDTEAYRYSMKMIELFESGKILNLNSRNRIGYTLMSIGKNEEGKKYLDEQIQYCLESIRLNRRYAKTKLAHYDLAGIYAYLGDIEKAYQYLEEFNRKNFYPLWLIETIKIDPLFSAINEDERFQAILQNMDFKYKKEHERIETWLKEQNMLQ
jgi:TolB-like protein/class 3 adenylate cyclase